MNGLGTNIKAILDSYVDNKTGKGKYMEDPNEYVRRIAKLFLDELEPTKNSIDLIHNLITDEQRARAMYELGLLTYDFRVLIKVIENVLED